METREKQIEFPEHHNIVIAFFTELDGEEWRYFSYPRSGVFSSTGEKQRWITYENHHRQQCARGIKHYKPTEDERYFLDRLMTANAGSSGTACMENIIASCGSRPLLVYRSEKHWEVY